MSQVQRASSKLADLAGIPQEDRPVSFPVGGLPRPNMRGYTPSLPQTKLYQQVAQGGTSPQPVPQGGLSAPQSSDDAPAWADPAIRAGLAMMGSRNPNAIGAIAEGGMAGLQAYAEQKRQREIMALRRKEMEEERNFRRQKLAVEMMKANKPEYVNVFNPETGARQTVASGSEEFNNLLSQGYVSGDPEKPSAPKYMTIYNSENPDEIKTVIEGSPEHAQALASNWVEGNPALKKLSKPETTVNLNSKQEGEYGKKVAGKYADTRVGYIDAAATARGTRDRVRQLRGLMKDVKTGALEPLKLGIKKYLRGIGAELADYGLDDNVGAAESFNAIAGTFLMDYIQQTKGAISERENDLFKSFSPDLSKTPEGNEILLDWADRLAKRQMQIEDLSAKYEAEKGQLDAGWTQKLNEWVEENPLVSDEEIERAKSVIGSQGDDELPPPPDEAPPPNPDTMSRDDMINFLQRKQSR